MALFNVVQLDVEIVVVAALLAGVLLDALVVERPQAAETLMWSIVPAGPSLPIGAAPCGPCGPQRRHNRWLTHLPQRPQRGGRASRQRRR